MKLGKWRQGATWAERFAQEPAASYVAVDGSSKVPELSSSALLLPLGVLCEDSDSPKKTPREACDHIKHAVEALNDKNDGWYDELLPNHTIVTAVRSTRLWRRGVDAQCVARAAGFAPRLHRGNWPRLQRRRSGCGGAGVAS